MHAQSSVAVGMKGAGKAMSAINKVSQICSFKLLLKMTLKKGVNFGK